VRALSLSIRPTQRGPKVLFFPYHLDLLLPLIVLSQKGSLFFYKGCRLFELFFCRRVPGFSASFVPRLFFNSLVVVEFFVAPKPLLTTPKESKLPPNIPLLLEVVTTPPASLALRRCLSLFSYFLREGVLSF